MVLVALCASRVEAQTPRTGAIVLQFDPSVRDAGMGGAAAASFWSNGEASWCNPALLGSVRGIGYDYSHTQLIPSLADDVFFRAERFRIGEFGIGASFSGEPSDRLGFARLDYGTSEVVGGGTFTSWEDIDTWAVGADLVDVTENILRAAHVGDLVLTRTLGVSIGYASKKVRVVLAPSSVLPEPGAGLSESEPVEVLDRGLLVRFTPYEGGRWFFQRDAMPEHGNLRFDVAYGLGIQNQPDEQVVFPLFPNTDPIARFTHHGIALRASRRMADEFRDTTLGWVVGPYGEYWSVSVAAGRETESYPGTGGDRITIDPVERFGLEMELLDLFAVRYGYLEDERGQISGSTLGLSLGLQYRGFAGVRWDFAKIPQAEGLAKVERHAVVAFVDGIEIARALRH